jgi:asparagine synthase (glutamine-hydrolysing)
MCGIAGIVGTEPGVVIEGATVHRMCQTIVHRGPDDEGIYTSDGVGLGMRRLSIIDLGGGHQPIHNEDKSIWVVFNGEIFNFPGLRSELESRGHRFYTDTDTEVIVHLYEEVGADCVHKLRGMFAFALYDERHKRFLLARDRLGIKPLHYSVKSGRLLFGSEIKAILAAAPELREVNNRALLQYFYFGYIPGPMTAFVDIQKLPPGHILELENGKVTLRQYWDVPAYGTHEPRSEDECLEELETRLAEAVRIRLIADVPLGALLSGGTDSSIVVALMARASSKPVETFSIGFGSADFDERSHARLVAERFGTNHHEFVVDPHMEDTVHMLTGTLEEPFGDCSMLPTYHVSRLARQHVTVALSGDGGDELFGGYDRYRIQLQRRFFNLIPGWAGRWYRESVFPRLPSEWYGRNFLFNISLPWLDRYLDSVTYLPATRRGFLLSDDFLIATRNGSAPLEPFRDCYAQAPAQDPLSRLLYLDTKTYLPSDILTKVDRMSMLTSLEVRVPILDHLFLEWVTALPAHWKLRNGKGKYILKKLGERLGVPREVLHRPKQGFGMPLVHWMRRELKAGLLNLLLEPRAMQRGYFRPGGVKQLVDEHLSGRREHPGRLWILLAFELWHRNFLEAQDSFASSLSSRPLVIGAQ